VRDGPVESLARCRQGGSLRLFVSDSATEASRQTGVPASTVYRWAADAGLVRPEPATPGPAPLDLGPVQAWPTRQGDLAALLGEVADRVLRQVLAQVEAGRLIAPRDAAVVIDTCLSHARQLARAGVPVRRGPAGGAGRHVRGPGRQQRAADPAQAREGPPCRAVARAVLHCSALAAREASGLSPSPRCPTSALGFPAMPEDQGDLYQLAYDEATRAVEQQAAALDNLRSRVGTFLAVVSLSTSFLGGIALQGKAPVGRLSWAAIGVFLLAVGLALFLLVPTGRRRWVFSMNAKTIVEEYAEGEHPRDLATAHRYLALYLQGHFDRNAERLDRLYWLFTAASVLLGAEVVLWLVVLIRR